ncbi:MAG: hypothetical protein Q7R78_01930 [bacterium]|nr:hypothetical protein [bacterium]
MFIIENISWLIIIFGIILSFISITFSLRVKGSVIGGVLQSFGLGILTGTIAYLLTLHTFINPDLQKIFRDGFMLISYLFMALGVWRTKNIA